MTGKEKNGEEGGLFLVFSEGGCTEKGGLEGEKDEEIYEQGGEHVDEEVDGMVARHVKAVESVVQGKGEIAEVPVLKPGVFEKPGEGSGL
jgi:hypothetical protein